MKRPIQTLRTAFLFCLLAALTSCSRQTLCEEPKIPAGGETTIALPEGVNSGTIFRCSMKDKSGNLWFGTTGAGVYKYTGEFFIRYAENEGLSNTTVYSIAQDLKGAIWVATADGIFHSEGERFSRLEIPGFDGSANFSPAANAGSSDAKMPVYCVICDRKGNTWFGTDGRGLWRYNAAGFTNFRCTDSTWTAIPEGRSAEYQPNDIVQSLLEDKNGNIWISAFAAGLNYYDGDFFHPVRPAGYVNAHTFAMIEDRSGNIWTATRLNGVCRCNPKEKTWESFTEKDGVSDNNASCLYEAKNGSIWFGSLGKAGSAGSGLKGISKYDGKVFVHIPSTGMRNNEVWTVIEDNSGNIWIGTKEFGLFRYDGKRFVEFTTQ